MAQDDAVSFYKSLSDSTSLRYTELEKKLGGHFTFKDIPIDGPLNHFVDQLKKQGFTVMKITDLDAILTGKFTGEDVHLFVQATHKTVYGVTVIYEKETSWKSIKSKYENMKSMLTAKYGEPVESTEKFDSSYFENSGMELYALREEKCTFDTAYTSETGNGMIRLRISPNANLVINYIDSLNYILLSSESFDDL